MPHDVFISYAARDKPAADAVCARLESRGVRCWIAPRDIQPGMSWGGALVDAIDQARLMVLMFSAQANESPQVRREVERAVGKHLVIIPVRLEDVKPTGDFEYFLGTPHWLDAFPGPFEQHLGRVAESAAYWLQRIEGDAANATEPGSLSSASLKLDPSLPTEGSRADESVSSHSPSRSIIVRAGAVLLIVFAIAGAFEYFRTRRATSSSTQPGGTAANQVTLAVLPFANLSSDKNDEYFSDGMTDEITDQLSKIAGLQVAARTSSFAFKNKNEDVSRIAGSLHVRNLLEGSVQRSSDRVRIEVQLVDATRGFTLWSERYDEKMVDVFEIQSRVAQGVAEKLRVKLLPDARDRLDQRPTAEMAAYDLYLQGQYYQSQFTEEGIVKAIATFRAALAKDPNFAKAYVALANEVAMDFTKSPIETIDEVRSLIQRALQLDDQLGEAHAVLAYAVLYGFDWNWSAGEREFRRAIELDPNNADILDDYGEFLDHMGRFDEALQQTLRAYELNPLGVHSVLEVGWVYRDSGDHARARIYFDRAIEMAPDNPFAHFNIGMLQAIEHDYPAALPHFERAAALGHSPLAEGWLGLAYGQLGRRDEALKVLDQLKAQSSQRYVDPCTLAAVYFGLGEKDRAFQSLDQALAERSYFLTTLKMPTWSIEPTIRTDPRFQAIFKKVGLPP